jgi:hypothetical protein
LQRPDEADFKEWLQQPVTEWVIALCMRHAVSMQDKWAAQAWESGTLSPEAFLEARVRADCYRDLAGSSYEDWKAIDDTEA